MHIYLPKYYRLTLRKQKSLFFSELLQGILSGLYYISQILTSHI